MMLSTERQALQADVVYALPVAAMCTHRIDMMQVSRFAAAYAFFGH
jgi:hypothetical protein